jgi:deoxyribonuclease-4
MAEFDRHLGLDRLRAFHVNDSKKELGCRVDRHEHIGRGCIGRDAFRFLMNDPRFASVPKVLETPKENDMDPVNLALLRGLVQAVAKAGAR